MEKLSLYQKLHKIQKELIGLKKDKKSFNYEYTSGEKVINHLKPLMNEYSLLLKQEILSIENERQDYVTINKDKTEKNNSEILSKVEMKFTWIDVETGDTDINLFGANGQNGWDKGVGSALTYGERYFLLKYFHIDTSKDDVDAKNNITPEQQDEIVKDILESISKSRTKDELMEVWESISEEQQIRTKIEFSKKHTSLTKAK
ncbi:ERF family protein [Chryseobacterium sp. JV274]|uniref:ERF family protein n=1 Tax=Chryseobacterium sp. JV274 TaxID=1932669 RepID=UPI0015C28BDA|nr:ERF family protein [Chryseobacterium sp. JV274]CAD0220404.1 protein of unknown function [Chryseobacterium sp. JV274]